MVERLLAQPTGTRWLIASLLYGAGLRVIECLRLRVKDVDLSYRQVLARDGSDEKDRVTMLPERLTEPRRAVKEAPHAEPSHRIVQRFSMAVHAGSSRCAKFALLPPCPPTPDRPASTTR